MEPNACIQLWMSRIYGVVDALSAELVSALAKEVFEKMTCS